VETLDTAGGCITGAALATMQLWRALAGEARRGGRRSGKKRGQRRPPLPILASSPAPRSASEVMVLEVDWWRSRASQVMVVEVDSCVGSERRRRLRSVCIASGGMHRRGHPRTPRSPPDPPAPGHGYAQASAARPRCTEAGNPRGALGRKRRCQM
jgi:hypothetical protein